MVFTSVSSHKKASTSFKLYIPTQTIQQYLWKMNADRNKNPFEQELSLKNQF